MRSEMTMRAHISRDIGTELDEWNQPKPSEPTFIGVVPCKAWTPGTALDLRDEAKIAVTEDLLAGVPIGADVQKNDRIDKITDRRGAILYAGPLAVRSITRRGSAASRSSYSLLTLTRHAG